MDADQHVTTHKPYKIALLGNPNSGKSSLFNLLAGAKQKVGNYAGITVDIKVAEVRSTDGSPISLLDIPGLYSMYPNSSDEQLVVDILSDPSHEHHPDGVIYIAQAPHLEAQLTLFTQLADLGIPICLVLNMVDELEHAQVQIDFKRLEKKLGVPVIPVSSRTGENIERLQEAMTWLQKDAMPRATPFYQAQEPFDGATENGRPSLQAQFEETMQRGARIKQMLAGIVHRRTHHEGWLGRFDRVATHWLFGPIFAALVMLLIFQAIFAWATYPMEGIEWAFAKLSSYVNTTLPDGWFASLLADGLIPGLSGVVVFVPQIAILFFLITLLEETGYMARLVFLFDHFLQRFGMNGRSVVALISGGACAIPAVMTTRTIENWKERLITILVTPFISCSARIPVYTVLIAFVIPYEPVAGIFNTQGLAFAGLIVLGAGAALIAGWVFKKILKSPDPSFLLLELPDYRRPDWTNVWVQVRSKVGAFITQAGKIILLISMLLWFLASFGPGEAMQQAELQAIEAAVANNADEGATADLIASHRLEASFAGRLGKVIEPVIEPLGFDWKIGIALITSFAAREVFVGSMATIYSVGSDVDEFRLRDYLANVRHPESGELVFGFATSLSLLLFYVFAMQCMSTLAVVKKETRSWKWPLIQFTFMTATAYLVSLVVYQLVG